MEYGITENVFGNLFFGYAFLPLSRETETRVTKQKMDHQIKWTIFYEYIYFIAFDSFIELRFLEKYIKIF